MAQTSNGSITITDLTDITDVYLEYCMAADSITTAAAIAAKTTWTSPERGWSTEYPTWQSGYQIWIREVTEREGITEKEYGTPYLDKAVNQINTNLTNLRTRVKKIWSDSTGSYMASGIGGNDVTENNVSTYGFNSKSTTTGVSFNYNAISLTSLGTDGLKLYSPILTNSIITGNRLDATLTSEGLRLLRGGIEAGTKNTTDYIYVYSHDDATNHTLAINSSGNKSDWRIIAGNKFGVDKAGNLYASSANIRGAITATAGYFGDIDNGTGFTIDSNSINTGTFGTGNSILICTGSSGYANIGNSGSINGWAFTAGNAFGVTNTGALYATGAHISGAINATSFNAYDSTSKLRAAVNTNGLLIYDTDGVTQVAKLGSSIILGKITGANQTRVEMNSSALNIIQRNTNNNGEESIASFGDTSRIGKESDRHIKINSNGFLFYRNSNSFPMKILGGYESGYLAIEDDNYGNYTGDSTVYTNRLLFDRDNLVTTLMTGYRSGTTIKEGQVDISYNKAGLYLTENTTVSAIILQKDEVTNQHTVMLTTPITYVGNDKLTFYNSSDGTSHKAVSVDTNGRLYTQNDSTNYVGILKSGTKRSDWTGDNYSIPKASSRYIMYITLSPGSWIVNGTVRFASNSTGVRRVGLSTSNSAGTDPLDCQIPAGSGAIQLRTVRLFELTAQTTYYLHAYQSSNSALNVTSASLHAMRIG